MTRRAPRLRWAMLVRALGQPLIMIPITSLATAGLDASQTATASSLFNMIRNRGGSIGIALLQTFTEAREQYHFSIIAERLTQNGLLVQERIRDLTQSFLPTANGIDEAPAMAVATIRDTVRRDAFIMAYSDCFFFSRASRWSSALPRSPSCSARPLAPRWLRAERTRASSANV